ncbi:CxxxxCH/CxxCH domain-containing protein [Myxococcota bacterium]|nr:CxxxxCH/CxxCH domain-containing protein [Myxococcota bacterium]
MPGVWSRRSWTIWVRGGLVLAACGEGSTGPGVAGDAAAVDPDQGVADLGGPDGGRRPEAGPGRRDSGSVGDAGPRDGGSPLPDGQTVPPADVGPPTPDTAAPPPRDVGPIGPEDATVNQPDGAAPGADVGGPPMRDGLVPPPPDAGSPPGPDGAPAPSPDGFVPPLVDAALPPPIDAESPPPPDAGPVPADPCTDCHGGPDGPAPPRAISGAVDPGAIGVGAHQRHLVGGTLRAGMPCESCHLVPDEIFAPGHIDGLPAELTFAGLAGRDGAVPQWRPADATCAGTYCHGGTLTGGNLTTPRWTDVGGAALACGACHGAPPPGPHPARADCATCHPETVRPDGTLDLAGGRHLDGHLDVALLSCDTCHGAPPPA